MNNYRLYDLMAPELATNRSVCPKHIIYPQQLEQSIYSNDYYVKGELLYRTYYTDAEHTNPVIKETYTYNRDSDDLLIISRDLEINWMLKSGEWGPDSKQLTKIYDTNQKKLDELRARRANLIIEVEGQAKDIGLAEAIQLLFKKYFEEIGRYRESGSRDFANAVQTDLEFVWLNSPTFEEGIDVRRHIYEYFLVGTYDESLAQ